jgi:hypothetical protein
MKIARRVVLPQVQFDRRFEATPSAGQVKKAKDSTFGDFDLPNQLVALAILHGASGAHAIRYQRRDVPRRLQRIP